MDRATITLQPVDDNTIQDVESLLAANDLPTADVRKKSECFSIAYTSDGAIGIGGIEQYGADGLLRSVVVKESKRGSGFGTELCSALAAEARADGIETLYLLTTTASDFFSSLGYAVVDRDDVPEPVRESAQFSDLCPVSATAMRKQL